MCMSIFITSIYQRRYIDHKYNNTSHHQHYINNENRNRINSDQLDKDLTVRRQGII